MNKEIIQKVVSYGLWLMIVVLGFSAVQNAGKILQTRAEIQSEKARVVKMQEQNQALEKQLADTQNSAFIEQQVRDKLGLAMPSEAIVVLPDQDVLRKLAPQVVSEDDVLPDPNWKRWEKLFF